MTDLMANVGDARMAKRAAALDIAGVGLMRAEFLFYSLGRHPKAFIRDDDSDALVATLRQGISELAETFHPRPVRYRSLDFKSNEMRSLQDGERFEDVEANPALGLRGASRYLRDRAIFLAELQAIRDARAAGLDNIQLMIPFIRSVDELVFCRAAIEEVGMDDRLSLWAMLEVPAMLYLIPQIAPHVDGVSIGTNDLTQMILGVDRDNPAVADFYDDGHPAVVEMVCAMIAAAKAAGISTSICGDRPSRDPAFVTALVEAGIDSISVTTNAVASTREILDAADKRRSVG